MAAKYKVGDIVRLKSGGPDMTVRRLVKEDLPTIYNCVWFAGKKLDEGNFPEDVLERVVKSATDGVDGGQE